MKNFKIITLCLLLCAGFVNAKEHTVKLLTQGDNGKVMFFDPMFVKISVGDTINFVPSDASHNAQSFSVPSEKSSFSKPIIAMGVGAASSSLLAGAVASAIPVNMQYFAGLPTIITALIGKVVIGTKGGETVKHFINGVLIAGISQTVSRFIPASFGQFGQEAKQNFSQEMKNQFKQETKPCNDIKTMRQDVTW